MTSFSIDLESIKKFVIQFQRRCMSDSIISDIDLKKILDYLGLDHP